MGKGDIKTRRGKVNNSSYGNPRKKAKNEKTKKEGTKKEK